MNKPSKYLYVITFLSLLAGIVFFLVQREILIVHWDFSRKKTVAKALTQKGTALSKKVQYYFWKEEKFHAEEGVLLWEKDDVVGNLKNLITHWLTCLHDEKLLNKDIGLISVTLSALHEEAFVSFNESLLSKEWSIIKKWHLIESLLKTIREVGVPIRSIVFLVNDASMEDDHLDFSQPYPLEGFLDGGA